MENKWKLVIVVVLALAVVASAVILYMPRSKMTASQKAMLAPSDIPEQGWRQSDFIDQPLQDSSAEDCWESMLAWYDAHGSMQALITVDLYHINSSEAARTMYDSFLSEYSRTNGTVVEQVSVGDSAFIV